MPALAERPEFLPPPEGGVLRALAIALVAHVLLVLALSVGLHWKRDDDSIGVEAELWSPTVQQAAPKAVEVPVAPPAPPPPVVQQPPAPPQKSEADIVAERERQQRLQAQREEEERERERQRLAAERKRQDELKKQEVAKKEAEQAKARKEAEQAKARKEKQEEQRLAKLREENLKRIQGLANGTGSPSSTGTAAQSSGPSSSYAGRVRARVKPNIVFTDDVPGNPSAEVEVRLSPDGTIVGRRLAKPSGVKSWDDAVLRAIDRTEQFPRDVDGRVPTSMILVFRPKDL